MKKTYLKPEVEYISLEAQDIITDIIEGETGEEEWGDLSAPLDD